MKKKWYKSKAILTAIFVGVVGVVEAFGISIPPLVYQLAGAFGLYSLRTGDKPIG